VEETLLGTACSSILFFLLGFNIVSEEGSIGFMELNYPAVFKVKHLIFIPNAAGSGFLPSVLKQRFLIPISVCK
jgi:hypothetical protein